MRATLGGVIFVLGLIILHPAAWAANCGDTTGAGGTRVACACGDTVTTNTKLKGSDLVVSKTPASTCAGDGLIIGANNITLDCKSLALRGNLSGDGVEIYDRSGVTVKQCQISGFDTGIDIDFGVVLSSSNTLMGNTLDSNGVGIVVEGTGNVSNVVQNNTITHSEVGVSLFAAGGNTVEKNTIGNTYAGIFLGGGSQANLVNSNIVQGSFLGIWVTDGSTQNSLVSNQLKTNFVALFVGDECGGDSSNNNVISRNRATQNLFGIGILSDANVVDSNGADRNGVADEMIEGDGIVVGGTGNTVLGNDAIRNTGHGICVVPGNINGGKNTGNKNGIQPDVDFDCSLPVMSCT